MVKDMTEGKPLQILVSFMLPMFLGNVFQQFYNIVDTIIVGNFVGANALAAVGATASMVFLLLAIAIGLTTGCSVLISQYYGAGDQRNMRRAIYTSVIFCCAVGVVLTFVGLALTGKILHLINMPEDIYEGAKTYIDIYYYGCFFLFLYNTLASICRAVGDSKTPLYFLVMAALLNIVLDLVFVVKFNMGVAGVAWATLIAQGISATSCFVYIALKVPVLHVPDADRVFSASMLRDLLIYAIPSTVQQCIVSFSLLAVQGLVNSFGPVFIAGYTAATKIDSIIIQPLISVTMALSTYTAQNIGAGKTERVYAGVKETIKLVFVFCVIISVITFFFGENLIGVFVDAQINAEVILVGTTYIKIVSVFYCLMGAMFTVGSTLRGAGDYNGFMLGSICNFVVRIGGSYILAGFIGSGAIWWSIPLGWFSGLLYNLIRFKSGVWKTTSIVSKRNRE